MLLHLGAQTSLQLSLKFGNCGFKSLYSLLVLDGRLVHFSLQTGQLLGEVVVFGVKVENREEKSGLLELDPLRQILNRQLFIFPLQLSDPVLESLRDLGGRFLAQHLQAVEEARRVSIVRGWRIVVPELLGIAYAQVMVHLDLRLFLQQPKPQHRPQDHQPPGLAPVQERLGTAGSHAFVACGVFRPIAVQRYHSAKTRP